jgi:transcriptional regulator with XRE-family HTH domain
MSKQVSVDLGKAIKSLRLAKAMRQSDLAEKVGVEPTTISRYERGDYAPSLDVLAVIAEVLETPLHSFFTEPSKEADLSSLRHELIDAIYEISDADALASILKHALKVAHTN